jgi:hypothetical protein
MLSRGEPGTCRFCRCHGDHCRLANGELCWLIGEQDTCNAAACLREFERAKKANRIELEHSRAAARRGFSTNLERHRKSRSRDRKKTG